MRLEVRCKYRGILIFYSDMNPSNYKESKHMPLPFRITTVVTTYSIANTLHHFTTSPLHLHNAIDSQNKPMRPCVVPHRNAKRLCSQR